jgi:hypothetical protein
MWLQSKPIVWDPDFIGYLLEWLGYDGVAFFMLMLEHFEELAPVIPTTDGPPHPVHFREGMAVRNAMREIHKKMGVGTYSAHFYDNHWQGAIQAALKMCEEGLTNEYRGFTENKAGAGPAAD